MDASFHIVRLAIGPSDALAAVEEAVELWGGEWTPGTRSSSRIRLPVQAGLRRGLLEARVELAGTEASSQITLVVERVTYRVHRSAAALLAFGGLGALTSVAWPFLPGIQPLLPVGLVVAVGAWLLVVTRLQNRGPEELIATIEAIAGGTSTEG